MVVEARRHHASPSTARRSRRASARPSPAGPSRTSQIDADGRPDRGAAPPQGPRGHLAAGRRRGARRLQKIDEVAYLRFASVYKDFQETTDFERELGLLLEKKEPAEAPR